MLMLKSRNMMLVSSVVFLILVILLRVTGKFLGENAVRIVGVVFAGKAEGIPLINFSDIDLQAFNPINWTFDFMRVDLNEKFHSIIDIILPAVIHITHMTMIQVGMYIKPSITITVPTTATIYTVSPII